MIEKTDSERRIQRALQGAVLLLAVLLYSSPALAASFSGKLVRVVDGDTVDVLHEGHAERIRLHGIDAPESGQAFGRKAKEFVLDVAASKMVRVEVKDKDRYGRTVGEVLLPDGRSLNRLLVQEGLAWWYRQYSEDVSLGTLEEGARAARRGLWVDPAPLPPWEWRRGKRESTRPQQMALRQKPSLQRSQTKAACGEKRTCAEMTSCEEARHYLQECGLARLDGDGDGVPCEALCK